MKFTRYVSKQVVISLHNHGRGQRVFEYPRRTPSDPSPETTFRQLSVTLVVRTSGKKNA